MNLRWRGWRVVLVSLSLVLALQGITGAQDIKDRKSLTEALSRLQQLRQESKHQEALSLAQQAVQAAEKLAGPETVETAAALHELALAYANTEQVARAEPLFLRSLAIREAKLGKDHLAVAVSLHNLGAVYNRQLEYARVEPLWQRCLAIREAKLGKDHPLVAFSLHTLGQMYLSWGKHEKVEPLLLRSLAIREAKLGKDHLAVAETLDRLGWLSLRLGLYPRADSCFQRSLEIREAKLGKDDLLVADSLNSRAYGFTAAGQHEKAEALHLRGLAILEAKLGRDHPRLVPHLNNTGRMYLVMGQHEKAEAFFQRGLALVEGKLGKDLQAALFLANLSGLHLSMGQPLEAEQFLERSLILRQAKLAPDHPWIIGTFAGLATCAESNGQTSKTVDHYDRSRQTSRRHAVRVLPTLSEAEQLQFLHGSNYSTPWHGALSLGLHHAGDPKIAERSAAELLNGKGIVQQTLAQSILLARDSRDPELAGLTRQLLDTRQQLARLTLAGVEPGQDEKRQQLSVREQDLSRRLRQAGSQASQGADWIETAQLQKRLPRDAVFIDIASFTVFDFKAKGKEKSLQPARYAAWITPAEGETRVLDLGPAEAIDRAVKEARQALESSTREILKVGEAEAETALRERLEALAKLVLHPLLPHIGKAKHWIISPDSNLWLVPWSALPLRGGKYAIEVHSLSYVVSGRDLVREPAPTGGKVGPALILADPDFDLGEAAPPAQPSSLPAGLRLGNIPRLPTTAAEARAIAPKLRQHLGQPPTVFMDQHASVGAFLAARQPRMVLFSTHGFVLPDQENDPKESALFFGENDSEVSLTTKTWQNPLLRCGLLLAGCNKPREGGDNGVLTGLQIVGADLRGCELVVLSACETGLGEVRNGEGVAGLRQAFQLAGADSVIATLWQVPDAQSAQLMIRFFDGLARKKGKAESLRSAQLAQIKARREKNAAAHPFFWAAYTLTGAAE